MFKNTLNTTQSLYHICSVVVQIPKLSVMFLMRPPKRILFQNLVLFKVLTNTPAFIISQSKPIFLK